MAQAWTVTVSLQTAQPPPCTSAPLPRHCLPSGGIPVAAGKSRNVEVLPCQAGCPHLSLMCKIVVNSCKKLFTFLIPWNTSTCELSEVQALLQMLLLLQITLFLLFFLPPFSFYDGTARSSPDGDMTAVGGLGWVRIPDFHSDRNPGDSSSSGMLFIPQPCLSLQSRRILSP